MAKCPDCNGFGYLDEDGHIECSRCKGDGSVPAHTLDDEEKGSF